MKKLVLVAVLAASSFGTTLAISAAANAGEGHWSVGKGVQCRIINGTVICTKARP